MIGRAFHVLLVKNGFTILYGRMVFLQLKIGKMGYKAFLADYALDVISLKKKIVSSRGRRKKLLSSAKQKNNEIKIKALQLSKAYSKEKKAYYHAGAVNEILLSDNAFKYFVKAIPIIERHNVTYRKFIRSQIYGLRWTNNGKGQFPQPSMLATEQAETRLMGYLQDVTENHRGKPVIINLTKDEQNMPLTKNHTYMACAKKVKDRIANLDETLYVQELQLVRKGEVKDWVKLHLETVAIV